MGPFFSGSVSSSSSTVLLKSSDRLLNSGFESSVDSVVSEDADSEGADSEGVVSDSVVVGSAVSLGAQPIPVTVKAPAKIEDKYFQVRFIIIF